MRRDLELDCDPAELVLSPPDRSRLKEMFRQFEFRGLLEPGGRRSMPPSRRRRWCSRASRFPGGRAELLGVGRDRRRERPRRGRDRGRGGRRPTARRASKGRFVAHDAKAQRVEPRGGHAARRLPDRPRPRDLRARRPRGRVRDRARSRPAGRRGHFRARPPRGRHASPRRAARLPPEGARRSSRSTARSSCRSPQVLGDMEDTGVKIDEYRMGEITARLADRVEELEQKAYELAGEEFILGSTQQVAQDPLREARADAGPQGQDRLLDGYPRPPQDPPRARDRRRDRGVAGVLEARSTPTSARCRR